MLIWRDSAKPANDGDRAKLDGADSVQSKSIAQQWTNHFLQNNRVTGGS